MNQYYYFNQKVISNEPPLAFDISIYLDEETKSALPTDRQDLVPTLTLSLTLSPTYPSTAPKYTLKHIQGLSPLEQTTLTNHITKTITEHLGTQLIFTLVSEIKTCIEDIVRERREECARVLDKKLQADHEAEVLRRQGTKVTVESFNAWNAIVNIYSLLLF